MNSATRNDASSITAQQPIGPDTRKDSTHDQTRDSRQMAKVIMDMATRSWSPSIRALVVELLNAANTEVRTAHESSAEKGMKARGLSGSLLDTELEDGQRLADTVQDDFDIEHGNQGSSREGVELHKLRAS